jgi:hypothetical protein
MLSAPAPNAVTCSPPDIDCKTLGCGKAYAGTADCDESDVPFDLRNMICLLCG